MTSAGKRTAWLAAGLVLAGCAQLDATAGVEPPPAEGRLYPNLATVPRPPDVAPLAARQAEADRLMAARDASLRDDQELRAVDPGRALPPPRPRAVAARPLEPAAAPSVPPTDRSEGQQAAPAPPREAAAAAPRPQLPGSLFMGTVLAAGERGALADFQRKVLEDSVAMARRTNGRIRLVGGRSAEDRQGVVDELVRLGLPAGRIVAPSGRDAPRAAIDVIVEN